MSGISGASRAGVAVLVLALAAWAGESESPAIIVDHNCVDLSAVPEDYLLPASSLRVLMRHASVGQGIGWGLDCLAGAHPTNPTCPCFPAGRYDRSNWVFEPRLGNWREKIDDLVAQAAVRTDEFDVFMSKFCYIDALGDSHPDWEYFCGRMEQLEADYPDKTFVWWTIPLTRDGQSGTDVFNAQMRAYCTDHRKVLFDLADIECHDPNGVKLVNAQGNEVICQDYTKEIHAGHLNPAGRVRVASAFWHLMARLAGWDPRPLDPNAVPSDPNMIPLDPNMAPLDPNTVPSDANNVAGGPQGSRGPSCARKFSVTEAAAASPDRQGDAGVTARRSCRGHPLDFARGRLCPRSEDDLGVERRCASGSTRGEPKLESPETGTVATLLASGLTLDRPAAGTSHISENRFRRTQARA